VPSPVGRQPRGLHGNDAMGGSLGSIAYFVVLSWITRKMLGITCSDAKCGGAANRCEALALRGGPNCEACVYVAA
jgi:hypothetical protein